MEFREATTGSSGRIELRAKPAASIPRASGSGGRYVALATALLVAFAGTVISAVDTEKFPSIGLGMWWAIVTVTAVAYGDVVPESTPGRIVAALLMLIGIGFLSTLTATIASTRLGAPRAGACKGAIESTLNSAQLQDLYLGRREFRRVAASVERRTSTMG